MPHLFPPAAAALLLTFGALSSSPAQACINSMERHEVQADRERIAAQPAPRQAPALGAESAQASTIAEPPTPDSPTQSAAATASATTPTSPTQSPTGAASVTPTSPPQSATVAAPLSMAGGLGGLALIFGVARLREHHRQKAWTTLDLD